MADTISSYFEKYVLPVSEGNWIDEKNENWAVQHTESIIFVWQYPIFEETGAQDEDFQALKEFADSYTNTLRSVGRYDEFIKIFSSKASPELRNFF